MTLLSMVVPVYGVEPWIEKCLRSIVEQSAFARLCELIVVDDGSPDRSTEIAEKVCTGRPNVHILRQRNQGLGAARNAGAAMATGRFLWFIDSDDWLSEGGLHAVLAALEAHAGVEVLNIDYVMSNGKHSTVINHAQGGIMYAGIDYLTTSCVQNPVQYYIWSLDFYRTYGLRFESGIYHEDALFTPIALSQARAVVRLARDCYVYNLREGSIMNSGKHYKHAADMLHVVCGLETRRRDPSAPAGAARALADYSALAVGGIYYYWKCADTASRARLSALLRPHWKALLRPVLRSGRLKYLLALLHMCGPRSGDARARTDPRH